MKYLLFSFGFLFSTFITFGQSQIIEDFTVLQCDSLIKANSNNPNFVILDVRTLGEYNPQHLEGAIMRDFYASDFTEQLNALNKDKTYLLHCRSGGRSGIALNNMKNLGFVEVYNMLGGINAWDNKSLPGTNEFSPVLMFVSHRVFTTDTILVGDTDTTTITITNRANDILKLTNFSILKGANNFTTDINLPIELLGSEDYSFNIFFTPTSSEITNGEFFLESNVSQEDIEITGIGKLITDIDSIKKLKLTISPNPANNHIQISGIPNQTDIEIINLNGQTIMKTLYVDHINISKLTIGDYFIRAHVKDDILIGKLNIVR